MKIIYDPHTDTLTVILADGVKVHESEEKKEGIILDYDAQGNLIGVEILHASKRMLSVRKIEFEMMPIVEEGPAR